MTLNLRFPWFRQRQAPPPPAPACSFLDLIPETYALAKRRYPFLPGQTPSRDLAWYAMPPIERAAFLLNYIAELYDRAETNAELLAHLPERPIVVYRTTDHPMAQNRDPRVNDPRGYAVFFDTDAGTRVEIHLGHPSYVGLGSVLQPARAELRKAARA